MADWGGGAGPVGRIAGVLWGYVGFCVLVIGLQSRRLWVVAEGSDSQLSGRDKLAGGSGGPESRVFSSTTNPDGGGGRKGSELRVIGADCKCNIVLDMFFRFPSCVIAVKYSYRILETLSDMGRSLEHCQVEEARSIGVEGRSRKMGQGCVERQARVSQAIRLVTDESDTGHLMNIQDYKAYASKGKIDT
uniref:Uncharacterized protein n=1 Tax=Parascaris univalens TaxID=6257 RepID=A0A915CFJ8_PARUN